MTESGPHFLTLNTYGDTTPAHYADAELMNATISLAKSLGQNIQIDEQINQFFHLCEGRKRLPKGSGQSVTEAFLASTITLISLKQNHVHVMKAIKVLTTFLRFDQSVFTTFKPNKPLLRKMNLSDHVMSSNPNEVESALELSAFFLRYHRAVDYGDFSDNAYVVQRIRRFVDYKYWAEIEKLDGKHETLDGSFHQFKAATQAALRELQATFEIWKSERDGIGQDQYRKLLELMLELEKKFDSKHLTVLESIRHDFAKLLDDQTYKYNANIAQNHTRLLELMRELEKKTDNRSQGLLGDLRLELESILRNKEFADDNYKRAFGLIGQIGEHIDLRNADIGNNFSSLKNEMENFVNERNRHIEGMHQKNHQRVLQLMIDLEKRAEERIHENAGELRIELARLTESQRLVNEDSQNQNYKKLLEIMIDLEKRLENKSGSVLTDLRKEIQLLIENSAARSESFTEENYKKTLELMLELEKKLDQRQLDLMTEMRKDFSKMLNQMDQSGLKAEIEDYLQKRLRQVEIKLHDQEETLNKTFTDLIKSAENTLQRTMDLKIKDANTSIGRLLDNKLNDTATKIGKAMDTKMAETSKALIGVIDQKLLEQHSKTQKIIDAKVRESIENLANLVDTKLKSLDGELSAIFESKINQHSNSLTKQIDTKVELAGENLFKVLSKRMDDGQTRMVNSIDGKIREQLGELSRASDKKLDDRSRQLTTYVDEKLEERCARLQQGIDACYEDNKNMLQLSKLALHQAEQGMHANLENKVNHLLENVQQMVEQEVKNSSTHIERVIDRKILESQKDMGKLIEQKLVNAKADLEKEIHEAVVLATQEISRSSEERLQTAIESLDHRVEDRMNALLNGVYQRVNKMFEDSDRDLKAVIRDALELSSKSAKENLEALRIAMEKFTSEKVLYTEQEVYKNIDTRLEKTEKQMFQIEHNLSQIFDRKVQELDKSIKEIIENALSKVKNDMLRVVEEAAKKAVATAQQDTANKIASIERKLEIFSEKLQQMVDSKISTVQKILETYCDELLLNLERKIDSRYLPRIEELEKNLRQTQDSLASFFTKHDLDMQKLARIEEAIREQIDLIHALNEKVANHVEIAKTRDDELLEMISRLERDLTSLQDLYGAAAGNSDSIASMLRTLALLKENDTNQQQELRWIKDKLNDEIDAKITIMMRNRDDMLARVELCESETQRMNNDTRNDMEQQGTRHNHAIGLLDSKQQKLIGVIEKLEEDVRIQVDRQIRDLESTDLRQQKEIADLNDSYKEFVKNYELFRETITRELKEEFLKINENFEAQARIIAQKEAKLRSEIEALRRELAPLFELIDEVKILIARLDKVEEAISLCRDRIEQLQVQTKNNTDAIEVIRRELENIKTALAEIDRLGRLIEEANKLWVFFQKFIDEQAMDHVKYIRSGDCTLTEKLFSMEWFARYVEFITPDTLIMGVNSFKEIYSGQNVEMGKNFMEHFHHQEGIPTVLQSLRNLKIKIEQELMDIETYDQNNAMLLMVLEPILINDLNHDMALKLNGMIDIGRIMMEQPTPTEIQGFEYSKKFVNTSFKYVLRCIAASVRNERGVLEFLANPKWLNRLLQILEEWKEEEQIANACKALRLILRNESTYDKIASQYPNMGNFLLLLLQQYVESAAIVVEAANCFRNISRKTQYLPNIKPGNVGVLLQIIRMPKHGNTHAKVAETLRFLNKHPGLAGAISSNGGIPKGYESAAGSQR